MLSWVIVLLVLSLISAALGFFGPENAVSSVAQVLFVVFFVLLVASAVASALRSRSVT